MIIDIKKMTSTELKALAYDMTLEMQKLRDNLDAVNREIDAKIKQEKDDGKNIQHDENECS